MSFLSVVRFQNEHLNTNSLPYSFSHWPLPVFLLILLINKPISGIHFHIYRVNYIVLCNASFFTVRWMPQNSLELALKKCYYIKCSFVWLYCTAKSQYHFKCSIILFVKTKVHPVFIFHAITNYFLPLHPPQKKAFVYEVWMNMTRNAISFTLKIYTQETIS